MNAVSASTDVSQLFGFTPEDLDANRRGELTDAQRKKVDTSARQRSGCLRGYVIIVVLLVVAILVFDGLVMGRQGLAQYQDMLKDPGVLLIIVVGLGLAVALISGFVWRSYRQINTLKSGMISHIAGPISPGMYSNRYGTAYYLRIGRAAFLVQDPNAMQFIVAHKGDRYQVYYVNGPAPLQLLSMEAQ